MNVYEIAIKPLSGFGTPLKGDTLFGHFCWQLAYDRKLCEFSLSELLRKYSENPFAIFSSAFPKIMTASGEKEYAFRIPALPPSRIFSIPQDKRKYLEERKHYKEQRWMMVPDGRHLESFERLEFVDDNGLLQKYIAGVSKKDKKILYARDMKTFIRKFTQPHNTINRLTGTTGEKKFAPFSVDQTVYPPNSELVVFAYFDERLFSVSQLKTALTRIGQFGFGKDASIGLGRFDVVSITSVDLSLLGSENPNACYTLSPCVPQKGVFDDCYFIPFTRFGRHGDIFAKSGHPFKAPVVMADEGAIFKPKNREIFKIPYIGSAVTGISKVEPETVCQGYSLYIPVRVEV